MGRHVSSRNHAVGTWALVDVNGHDSRRAGAPVFPEHSTRLVSTVADPFAGSGTTLLVAQRLGRSAIGIDLSEDYCQIAQRRVEPHHAQQRLPVGDQR